MLNQIFPEQLADSYVARLFIAAVLGALIGLERDIHGRAAGVSTYLLVCMGAALFMLISQSIARIPSAVFGDLPVMVDPGRIAAQIITGIGFLGAGAIIKEGLSVRGLTTAACMWIVAGIGMAAGAGFFDAAIVATVISLAGLILLNYFERIYAKDSYRALEIRTSNDTNISDIIETVKRKNLKIIHCDYEQDYDNNVMSMKFLIRLFHRGATDKLSHKIVGDLRSARFPIKSIKWSRP
ncbi:MAG: MgtC/SapB family protein [Thermoplasmata archaeon]|nr:MgtC/SapB family protein [Thermoplasmata archaeon]